MNTEISGVILQWTLLVALCYPLGRYIAKVYRGERTWLDFMAPVERGIYRFCGIDPAVEMNWKQFLKALLTVNLFWFFWGMLLLVFQGWLPLNPDGNPGQSPDLAFNTCISFMVNCNLQHYSGETGLSYFTQLFVIMLFQFVTAACGMAAMAGMMKALAGKTTKTIGNFWVFLTRSVTRILLPLSLAVGILLVINGTPMSFDGKQTLTTLEGAEQVISQGPTAAIVPIKQLGTNGGGYFGTNSAHPLENPNAFTNILECWSILILPMAMVFAFGFYTRRRRLATWIFGVMLLAYTAGVVLSVWQETGGSRQIDGMGISQELGSMEGKEIRIGSAASAMWGMTTTVTSNGSVNSMHGGEEREGRNDDDDGEGHQREGSRVGAERAGALGNALLRRQQSGYGDLSHDREVAAHDQGDARRDVPERRVVGQSLESRAVVGRRGGVFVEHFAQSVERGVVQPPYFGVRGGHGGRDARADENQEGMQQHDQRGDLHLARLDFPAEELRRAAHHQSADEDGDDEECEIVHPPYAHAAEPAVDLHVEHLEHAAQRGLRIVALGPIADYLTF